MFHRIFQFSRRSFRSTFQSHNASSSSSSSHYNPFHRSKHTNTNTNTTCNKQTKQIHSTNAKTNYRLIFATTSISIITAATFLSQQQKQKQSSASSSSLLPSFLSSLFPSTTVASCVGHDYDRLDTDENEDFHKHSVATKTWRYYSGPGGDLTNMCLFTGNANPNLAAEIAAYLGLNLNRATVGRFSDGEIKIQVHDNVRQTHCFIVQPISNPVNDNLMELLLLVSTLRRASAAEITVVMPYFGYERQDRKLASRVPISAADVAIMLEEMGVDRVVAVDLHAGQIQGFFPPQTPVENIDSMAIGALYFSEKHLRKPVICAASAGGVIRAKKFRETLSEQGINSDLAMVIEDREADQAGRFAKDATGRMQIVGQVQGCDAIIVEDIVDTASTMAHASTELKKAGARNVYAFVTHGLFSSEDAASKIEKSPIKELVTTNTVAMK